MYSYKTTFLVSIIKENIGEILSFKGTEYHSHNSSINAAAELAVLIEPIVAPYATCPAPGAAFNHHAATAPATAPSAF